MQTSLAQKSIHYDKNSYLYSSVTWRFLEKTRCSPRGPAGEWPVPRLPQKMLYDPSIGLVLSTMAWLPERSSDIGTGTLFRGIE